MNYNLHLGDNLATLKTYPDNHFDSIVTDPPYGIEFLGKDWDKHTGVLELWQECLRVLKPGGYLLAFSAARTYHQLASNVELAGFEIRDQLMWLYASGFPKAQDIGKAIEKREGKRENAQSGDKWENADGGTGVNTTTCRTCGKNNVLIGSMFSCDKEVCDMRTRLAPAQNEWAGFKTALKPAHEPIVMARKPIKSSVIDNVLKNGLGALNIDATRVPWADADPLQEWNEKYQDSDWRDGGPVFQGTDHEERKKKKSDRPSGSGKRLDDGTYERHEGNEFGQGMLPVVPYDPNEISGRYPSNVIGEVEEGYQKYFYCPKVSRRERHGGFDEIPYNGNSVVGGMYGENQAVTRTNVENKGNNHPTVKPVALMDYLIKLVTPPSTPELQRKVLDPFMGSGSTGMAAVALGNHFTGCELDPKYVAIAQTRIDEWNKPETEVEPNNNFKELFGV